MGPFLAKTVWGMVNRRQSIDEVMVSGGYAKVAFDFEFSYFKTLMDLGMNLRDELSFEIEKIRVLDLHDEGFFRGE
ncbi:hypothetical protein LguiA_021548 [Lonicera macranthoides]